MISGPRRWILQTAQRKGTGSSGPPLAVELASQRLLRLAPGQQSSALQSRKLGAPKVIHRLARLFLSGPSDDENARWLVYRAGSVDWFRDPWLQSIVELGDGRTFGEIAQALYQRELQRGAGLVDIGAWKSFFDDSVFRSIGHLVCQGFLRIEPGRSRSPTEMAGIRSKDNNGDSGCRYTRMPFVQRRLAAPKKPEINAAGRTGVGHTGPSQRHSANGVSPVSGPAGSRTSAVELRVPQSGYEGEEDAGQGMGS